MISTVSELSRQPYGGRQVAVVVVWASADCKIRSGRDSPRGERGLTPPLRWREIVQRGSFRGGRRARSRRHANSICLSGSKECRQGV